MTALKPTGGTVTLAPGHLPLRIEWRLASPWVPPQLGLHLDGLLGHAMVQRAVRDFDPASRSDSLDFDDVLADMPLARCIVGDRWTWCGSLLNIESSGSERRHMTTKTPAQRIAELTEIGALSPKGGSKVDTVRGFYKAGSQHITLQHADRITAWCIGDPDAIADLLGDVTALGSKTRLGFGQIACADGELFQMEEDPVALAHWQLRHLPAPGALEGTTYAKIQACLRTPYWRRDRAEEVWRPVTA